MSSEFLLGYQSPDYLVHYRDILRSDEIIKLRQERESWKWKPKEAKQREAIESVQHLQSRIFDFSSAVVKLGAKEELSTEEQELFLNAVRAFIPWKKGPFELFGISIDSEWRSDWKWERLLPHFESLKGRKVADIGCHNGYFMFRMLQEEPQFVIGFEPFAKNYWNFQLMQDITHQERLHYELLGVEHFHLYPRFFDTIFCLGIIYHHTDPVGLLKKLHDALAQGGEIVIDCQGIPGDEPISLTPRRRYARARSIWFLPTQSCLENWMFRAGFIDIRTVFAEPLSIKEQRRTKWADINSLRDFLDPDDITLTEEGYPAPWRYYVVAKKG